MTSACFTRREALAAASTLACEPSAVEARPGLKPRLLTIPHGVVSDRVRCEIRFRIPNPDRSERTFRARFYRGRPSPSALIGEANVTVPPLGVGVARSWWPTRGHAGAHRLTAIAESGPHRFQAMTDLDVRPSQTRSLPYFTGMWIESGAALEDCAGVSDAETERNLRSSVDAMKEAGVDLLILAYVELSGVFYYPSQVEFYDHMAGKLASGKDCRFDLVGILMDQAARNRMAVMPGLGRSGDLWLLWRFGRPNWDARNEAAVDIAGRIGEELWARYGHLSSFYGWYCSHEMNDIGASNGYLRPLSARLRKLAPELPLLVAPAGTPFAAPEALKASAADIFAFQDAVGSGYIPYQNTFDPENRMVMLDEIYPRYAKWFEGLEKHLWSDLEVWEMDGSKGYSSPFPPKWGRVKRQIDLEAPYVDALTAYAWHGYLRPPASRGGKSDPRAERLYADYRSYLSLFRRHTDRRGAPSDRG